MPQNDHPLEPQAFNAALNWINGGMTSVFIQDANSLIIKPSDLMEILTYLKDRFPWVERITSYARSHTIARIKDKDLEGLRTAGLNRIHIGMESGSLAQMTEEVGNHYTKDVLYRSKQLTSVLEPILTIVLGVLVLIMALAIFLPMWSLIKVFQG